MRARFLCCVLVLAWVALPASSLALTPIEQLGKEIFFDKISSPDWMSCSVCHGPDVGFTGPTPATNKDGAVYNGAIPQRFGNRKPPSAAYATLAPIFHYDAEEETFVGGNFWDGRATGEHLGNPAADQALGPFLNPVEQNNPSKAAVLAQIASSKYAYLWTAVWGSPVSYGTEAEVLVNYDRVGLSIAAYEGSSEVNAFTSKWDYFMRGEAELSQKEQQGMELFNGKAGCNGCHPAPLFTDYTYDNLGAPKNPQNPFYRMDMVYLDDGTPINPLGPAWIDPGLGGFLNTLPESYFAALGLDKATTVQGNWGKQKVPTLRNVAKAPSEEYTKAYLHNGVFDDLKKVVDFYNTRDVGDWPPPEVPENVNHDELGNLGLSKAEVNAIVAFLGTLSDGWSPTKNMNLASSTTVLVPSHLQLVSANPARATGAGFRLALMLPTAQEVELTVVDVRGQLVKRLTSGALGSGRHIITWDGTNTTGAHVASGAYFATLRMDKDREVKRIVWLK
jgi:cytochrome c peroxidase